ncbi:hypothetical protein [Mangrovibacterium marinum]|uniref:hypothetical protein n=1 Tax=Mangrovibacterium marinum TaxID=1639118 RepID=UPI002A18DFB4|nr:hypothetical protein [Mangrovibacterium marinum]
MENTELFLTVVLGLAAYVGSVRLAIFNRRSQKKDDNKLDDDTKKRYRHLLLGLIGEDFLLILTGALLVGHLYGENCDVMLCTARCTFLLALIYLAGLHVHSWYITCRYT